MSGHYLIISLLLLSIIWQDFKYRAIYWYLLPLLVICFLLKSHIEENFNPVSILLNLSVVLAQVGILHLWVYYKNKRWDLHARYLGWGDVLFFCTTSFYFSFPLFVIFQVGTLLLIWIGAVLFQIFIKKHFTIPLAGCQALILFIMIGLQYIGKDTTQIIDTLLWNNRLIYGF